MKPEFDLIELIDQFLSERNGLGLMSVAQVASYRIELVGTSRPFDRIGYVRFLKDLGMTKPNVANLNGQYIGRYWEYLTQHYGVHYSGWAMKVLCIFWKWCVKNHHIHDRRMPPDLKCNRVNHPYRISVSLTQAS